MEIILLHQSVIRAVDNFKEDINIHRVDPVRGSSQVCLGECGRGDFKMGLVIEFPGLGSGPVWDRGFHECT